MLRLTKKETKKIIRALRKRTREDWQRDAQLVAKAIKAIREDRKVSDLDLMRRTTV
jgi:hypothetical protein